MNPIVQESEPELEALADAAEPEAVTEDAASSATPAPGEFPAGPGDAPVAGEDGPSSRAARAPVRVEDDPDDGVPIVHITA